MIQFYCPRCGGALSFSSVDQYGAHWRCTACGMTDADITYTYSANTTDEAGKES